MSYILCKCIVIDCQEEHLQSAKIRFSFLSITSGISRFIILDYNRIRFHYWHLFDCWKLSSPIMPFPLLSYICASFWENPVYFLLWHQQKVWITQVLVRLRDSSLQPNSFTTVKIKSLKSCSDLHCSLQKTSLCDHWTFPCTLSVCVIMRHLYIWTKTAVGSILPYGLITAQIQWVMPDYKNMRTQK